MACNELADNDIKKLLEKINSEWNGEWNQGRAHDPAITMHMFSAGCRQMETREKC
jgi:hypothetical protein